MSFWQLHTAGLYSLIFCLPNPRITKTGGITVCPGWCSELLRRCGQPCALGQGEVQTPDPGRGGGRGAGEQWHQVESGRGGVRVPHEDAGQPGEWTLTCIFYPSCFEFPAPFDGKCPIREDNEIGFIFLLIWNDLCDLLMRLSAREHFSLLSHLTMRDFVRSRYNRWTAVWLHDRSLAAVYSNLPALTTRIISRRPDVLWTTKMSACPFVYAAH